MENEPYLERIKSLKRQQKITNEHLSELTGIPLGTLSKILAGFNDSPKLANISAICQVLGCSIDYIITGEPDNVNNYLLADDEIRLIETYRKLDEHGRDMTEVVMHKEMERISAADLSENRRAKENAIYEQMQANARHRVTVPPRKRAILLYDMPVSAGTGVFLDSDSAIEITIPVMDRTDAADYAIRISGHSMEPKFHDGDIILVEQCENVEVGELGIFVLDGNGYFKRFGGDCLISLNPEFGPIMLKDFSDASCVGRVIGKLKKR